MPGSARFPWLKPVARGYPRSVQLRHKFTSALAAGLLALGLAACGESDVDQARSDVQDKADELKGDLDNVSKKDLREKLDDVKKDAKQGGTETKQKARELQRKIERELNSRD